VNYLIYKRRRYFVLIDLKWETVVGEYDNEFQALHGWRIYIEQGRLGVGFRLYEDEEQLIDIVRRYCESPYKIKVRRAGANKDGCKSIRSSEIECSLGR
jgi:hypothetical protein